MAGYLMDRKSKAVWSEAPTWGSVPLVLNLLMEEVKSSDRILIFVYITQSHSPRTSFFSALSYDTTKLNEKVASFGRSVVRLMLAA